MISKIIINGRGGAGKDIFADYLVEKYGFAKISFANPIYDIAREYFDMTFKDRYILQSIGQKFREIKPTIWIDYAMKTANKIDKICISDCRQSNEYNTALKNGFLPIRINTDLDIRIKRLEERDGKYPDLSLLENSSETGADKCRFIEIYNNSSFENLYRQIDFIMGQNWDDKILEFQREMFMEQYC